jgi:hypothetical protein
MKAQPGFVDSDTLVYDSILTNAINLMMALLRSSLKTVYDVYGREEKH